MIQCLGSAIAPKFSPEQTLEQNKPCSGETRKAQEDTFFHLCYWDKAYVVGGNEPNTSWRGMLLLKEPLSKLPPAAINKHVEKEHLRLKQRKDCCVSLILMTIPKGGHMIRSNFLICSVCFPVWTTCPRTSYEPEVSLPWHQQDDLSFCTHLCSTEGNSDTDLTIQGSWEDNLALQSMPAGWWELYFWHISGLH